MHQNNRNLASTLLKDPKQKCVRNFLKNNINDILKTWKDIKSIISMRSNNNILISIIHDSQFITKPANIAIVNNIFYCKQSDLKQLLMQQ